MRSRGRNLALLTALVVSAGCGGDDEAATVTETATVQQRPQHDRHTTDPTEKRNELFLSIDDDAIAADKAIGFALDGQANAPGTLAKIRTRLLDKNLKLLMVDDSLDRQMNGLIGAVTEAKVAAEAGDTRGLVEARVATQDARMALTKAALARP
ncbi:MAG: hypothetical protein QOF68_1750 [Gaiellales bacterium]|jgi:hypothetical protein|nr:hypothetical protein [Gaiellales bacterium]